MVYPLVDPSCGGALGTFISYLLAIMKHIEKITLITATAVSAVYLIREAIRMRSERLFRLAAGESPYERTHPQPRSAKKVMAAL